MGVTVKPWKRKYTYKPHVPNKPGIYTFYDKNGKLIYVGHARKLRHRIQSYTQKDCFKEHPTKRPLRNKISKFKFVVMPKTKAQVLEKRLKKKARYNRL